MEPQIYNSFTEVIINMTSLRKIIYPSYLSICYNTINKNYINLYEKDKDIF